jgi:hypothetical protein
VADNDATCSGPSAHNKETVQQCSTSLAEERADGWRREEPMMRHQDGTGVGGELSLYEIQKQEE